MRDIQFLSWKCRVSFKEAVLSANRIQQSVPNWPQPKRLTPRNSLSLFKRERETTVQYINIVACLLLCCCCCCYGVWFSPQSEQYPPMNFKWTRIKRQVICTLAPCRALTAACPCRHHRRRRRRQSVDCRGISNSAAVAAAVSSDIQTGRMVEWARVRACFCLFVLVCSLQHTIWIGSFAIAMGKWTRNDSQSQQQQRSASSSLHRGGGGACSCTHSPSNKKRKAKG